MDHIDLPSGVLLDTVIDKLEYLKTLVGEDYTKKMPSGETLKETYIDGITPISLNDRMTKAYKIDDDGNVKWFEAPYGAHLLSEEEREKYFPNNRPTGQMLYDLAQYQVKATGKEVFDTLYNSTKNNNDIANEFNILFNEILPKLIIIKKMRTLQAQHDVIEGYGYKHDDLKQYLAHLLNEAETTIKKYLQRGNFVQPIGNNRMFMRYMFN